MAAQMEGCNSNINFSEAAKLSDPHAGGMSTSPECAVCLQVCIHPAQLPCSHIFCYLCVKGVANQSKRCPMCRQEIPTDFLEHPQLIEIEQALQKNEAVEADEPSSDEYQWFYEGRNGWWQYDERTSLELETAYKQGKRSCELLIAGFLYVADFGSMLQLRRNDPSRKRRIKRDLCNAPKKGVAGLRLNNQSREQEDQQQQSSTSREIRGGERSASPASDNTGDGTTTPMPPSNSSAGEAISGDATPLTTAASDHQRSDSLHQVLEQMRSLVLRENLTPHNSQDLQGSIHDGSFSDNSMLSWLHQTSADQPSYPSDEENT